jgi:stearoyl-CoA desaturase (delta-9 desaturase)
MEEAARADHEASIAAAQRASVVHPEFSPLVKVVPAAAAIAVATATAAQADLPKKTAAPDLHQQASSRVETPPSA